MVEDRYGRKCEDRLVLILVCKRSLCFRPEWYEGLIVSDWPTLRVSYARRSYRTL